MKKINNTLQLNKWSGNFGHDYTNRNNVSLEEMEKRYKEDYGISRMALNKLFLSKINKNSQVLEVGSNIGNQLLCLQKNGFKNLYGIEPMSYAREMSKETTKNINIIKGDAFDIPFKDEFFDLVFTSVVLIHINPKDIKQAIKEIYRCAKKYIWGFEYYSDKYKEINYRGNSNLLWKANFPKIYTDLFPDLKIVKIKYLNYLKQNNTDIMFLLKKTKS